MLSPQVCIATLTIMTKGAEGEANHHHHPTHHPVLMVMNLCRVHRNDKSELPNRN